MSLPRNQRISSGRQRKQQHLLDVKIRVGKERQRRYRVIAGFIFKTILLVALIGGVWFGGREGLRRYFWENPDYFVRDPLVKTDGTLTIEQVLTAAGVVEGRNIFTVDLGKARAALEKLPQVESVEVLRTLPNHLAINIIERRPIAWVTLKKEEDPTTSERAFLIDARSVVLRSRVLLPEYYHLPIISGVQTENLVPGQRVKAFDVQAALELVRLNAASTRFQVRNIDLAKGYCLVVTDQRRAKITFGFDRIDTQLARLNRLLDVIEPTQQEIQTVNLIPERNVPVTFYDPVAEAAAAEAAAALAVQNALAKANAKDSKSKTKSAPARPPEPAAETEGKPARSPPKARSRSTSPDRRSSPTDRLKKPFKLNG